MPTYTIKVPAHAGHCIKFEKSSFNQEQEAVDTLTRIFKQEKINFKIKQTRVGKVFISTQKGELASVVYQ